MDTQLHAMLITTYSAGLVAEDRGYLASFTRVGVGIYQITLSRPLLPGDGTCKVWFFQPLAVAGVPSLEYDIEHTSSTVKTILLFAAGAPVEHTFTFEAYRFPGR